MYIWGNILACEFKNKEKDEGIPYLDIIEDQEGGKLSVYLSNRLADRDKLQHTLKRINVDNQSNDIKILLKEYTSVDSIKSLIEKLG